MVYFNISNDPVNGRDKELTMHGALQDQSSRSFRPGSSLSSIPQDFYGAIWGFPYMEVPQNGWFIF